jgi:hypothetical protein
MPDFARLTVQRHEAGGVAAFGGVLGDEFGGKLIGEIACFHGKSVLFVFPSALDGARKLW